MDNQPLIDKEAREKIKEILKHINKELKNLTKSERRTLRGSPPRGTFIKRMFRSDAGIIKQEIKTGALMDHLESAESDILAKIHNSLSYVKSHQGEISHDEFQGIAKLILNYLKIIEEEFPLVASVGYLLR